MWRFIAFLIGFKKGGIDTLVEDDEPLPVVVSNPTADPETGLAKEAKQLPDNHNVTVSNQLIQPLTAAQLDEAEIDLGERDAVPGNVMISAAGETPILTPASGKRFRLLRVLALNKLTAASSPLITIKLGVQVVYENWAIAARQKVLGPVNGAFTVTLSEAGNVALTYIIEEVD